MNELEILDYLERGIEEIEENKEDSDSFKLCAALAKMKTIVITIKEGYEEKANYYVAKEQKHV